MDNFIKLSAAVHKLMFRKKLAMTQETIWPSFPWQ